MSGWVDLMSTRDRSLLKTFTFLRMIDFTFPDKGEYFVENTNRGAYSI